MAENLVKEKIQNCNTLDAYIVKEKIQKPNKLQKPTTLPDYIVKEKIQKPNTLAENIVK